MSVHALDRIIAKWSIKGRVKGVCLRKMQLPKPSLYPSHTAISVVVPVILGYSNYVLIGPVVI